MRQPIGYREKDGTRVAVFNETKVPPGWVYHPGDLPGPDELQVTVTARLDREILDDLASRGQWPARRLEIEEEERNVRDASRRG